MAETRIASVSTKVVEIPLKKEWRIALYGSDIRHHVIVRLTTEAGHTGYGEVSPAPAFMGEEARIVEQVIRLYLGPAALGLGAFDFEGLHGRMDAAIAGNGAAKSAMDIAMYDLAGKVAGLPVHQLLGGIRNHEIPLVWVLGMQDADGALQEADAFVSRGVQALKVKVGKDSAREHEILSRLRGRFGDELTLRVDCNQGLRPDTALRELRDLESYELDSIEQPVRAWNIETMKRLADALDTPVMADESVFSLQDAFKLARESAADVFNIKVGKVGGLFRAKQIAAVAEASGIILNVGSNLELGLGTAASVHFAAATPGVLYPCDMLIGFDLHAEDIVEQPFSMDGGVVSPPMSPGLGVTLKAEHLEGFKE